MARSTLGIDSGEAIKPLVDWGLAYPSEYLKEAFTVWLRSNYAVYPNGLAADFQPKLLKKDLHQLLHLYSYHFQREKKQADKA